MINKLKKVLNLLFIIIFIIGIYTGVSVVFLISNVELEYVITYYGEEDYALVPVWLYSTEIDMGGWDSTCFGVNALDGSIIEFGYKNYATDVWSY